MSTLVLSQGAKLMTETEILLCEIDDRAGNQDWLVFDSIFETLGSCMSDSNMIGHYVLKIPITSYRVLENRSTDPTNFVSSWTRSFLGPILNIFKAKPATDKYEVTLISTKTLKLPNIPWKTEEELFVAENGTKYLLLPIKTATPTEESFVLEAFSNVILFGFIPLKRPLSHEWKHLDRVTYPNMMWFFNFLIRIITLGHIGNLAFFLPLDGQWMLIKKDVYSNEQNNYLIDNFKRRKMTFIIVMVLLALALLIAPFLFFYFV
jgi:hypothetical protein